MEYKSVQELIYLLETYQASYDHLELMLTEPQALNEDQRGEIGSLLAKYQWLPDKMSIEEISLRQEKLEQIEKKYSK